MKTPRDADIEAITARLDELFTTYDGRTIAAVLGVRTARSYAILREIGVETPESVRKLFDYLLMIALEKPDFEPKVIYESDAPGRTQ